MSYNPPNEFFGESRSFMETSPRVAVLRFVHPSAILGEGTRVWHFAVVQDRVVTGERCSIGSNAELSAGCILGSNVRIGHGTITAPGMKIGDNVFIGPNVTFCDDDHPKAGNTGYTRRPPLVMAGASIGAGAVIMPGVTIGQDATVGAGALVLHDVPDGATVWTKAETITRQP
jgi:acetyltransferase-like isoleucine patch superfamily enzyme